MILSLPKDLEGQFTPEDVRLHLALGLFLDCRVTLGQGAVVAGVSETEFLRELGRRRIPMHYDDADAAADAAAAAQWSR